MFNQRTYSYTSLGECCLKSNMDTHAQLFFSIAIVSLLNCACDFFSFLHSTSIFVYFRLPTHDDLRHESTLQETIRRRTKTARCVCVLAVRSLFKQDQSELNGEQHCSCLSRRFLLVPAPGNRPTYLIDSQRRKCEETHARSLAHIKPISSVD